MEEFLLYFLLWISAFSASLLTFFSGFGLGTILLVVFGFFLPMELAIFSTAIVHFLNAVFKVSITFKRIDWNICVSFGLYALIGSLIGSFLLLSLTFEKELYSISFKGISHTVKTIDFILACIIGIFAISDFFTWNSYRRITNSNPIGGFITGLIGGFSGHQGAVRSYFLSKKNIEAINFAATSAMLSFMVDIVRISNYSNHFKISFLPLSFIGIGVFGALLGSILGKQLIEKTTMPILRKMVRFFLLLFVVLKITGVL